MISRLLRSPLFRQSGSFIVIGLLQLLLDWLLFVLLTACGVTPSLSNVASRISGAILGFWLNGRYTYADNGQARLGWLRLLKFTMVWIPLTALSTWLVSWTAVALGLQLAWLAKPLVEATLAVLAFFLWRHVVYR